MKSFHKIELKNKQQNIPRTRFYFKSNSIYCGDCEFVLSDFPEEYVDLIYIDPPFFSNKNYEVIWNDGYEIRSFKDRWKGGIEHYIGWMRSKIEQIRRVLKRTGSFYLHCDHHANAHLRILCDDLFGPNNFRNEIIWKRYSGNKGSLGDSQKYGSNTDTILFYTKSENYFFDIPKTPLSQKQIERDYKYIEKETERIFTHGPMAPIKGPKRLHFKDKNITLTNEIGFRWSQETLDRKFDENPYCIYWTKNGTPRYKIYLDDHKGIPLSNIWDDIKPISSSSKERLGYPTQKPEALLERIIKASSKPTDIILDAFCGCGTTLTVAKRLGRRFIGIDVSPTACKVIAKRINYKKEEIIGMKYSLEQLKELPHFEFQNWVCEKIGAKPNPRKTGDLGIDGIMPLSEYGANLPIEVKQHKISRPDVDKFETVLRRTKKKVGYMVAFSFSKGAIEEIARTKNVDKFIIIPITIEKLLEKEV